MSSDGAVEGVVLVKRGYHVFRRNRHRKYWRSDRILVSIIAVNSDVDLPQSSQNGLLAAVELALGRLCYTIQSGLSE